MTTRTVPQLFDLKGKTALITGGSRGLGLQMAHALGEQGARVVISSRKASDLEAATAELQAAGIDARWIAAQMEARLHASFPPAAVARLMAVTGRLPAFMKAGSIALADGVLRIEDDAAVWTDALLVRPEFQRNCREIWQDLSPLEQQALLHLHQGTPVVGDAVQDLQAMGFVRATDAGATIFSPIFAAFLARMPTTSTPVPAPAQAAALSPLVADSASGVVLRNGHPLDVTLTNHEHHLLRYFLSHPGEVCTKDDLMAAVWADDVLIDGVRDDRLAQLIKRLRGKIEPTPAKPTYIQTVRGRGYRLSI